MDKSVTPISNRLNMPNFDDSSKCKCCDNCDNGLLPYPMSVGKNDIRGVKYVSSTDKDRFRVLTLDFCCYGCTYCGMHYTVHRKINDKKYNKIEPESTCWYCWIFGCRRYETYAFPLNEIENARDDNHVAQEQRMGLDQTEFCWACCPCHYSQGKYTESGYNGDDIGCYICWNNCGVID